MTKISKPVLYKTLWAVGAVLVLAAVPFYKHPAAFSVILILGIACFIAGFVIWAQVQKQKKHQKTIPGPGPSRSRQSFPVLAEIGMPQQPPKPAVTLAPAPAPVFAPAAVPVIAAPPLPVIPVLPVPVQTPVVVQKVPKKSTLKKDTKKKKKHHAVKVSEKSDVKEFRKLEASNAVATQTTQCVPTKGEGVTVTVPSLLQIAAKPIYTYPTVEEIRIERERFQSRPDTPDLDRKRRTSLLREYALDMGHPRDGSMIPLIKPLSAA